MVQTKDSRYGYGSLNMNTSWANDYIYDCWRMELKDEGEYKEFDLYEMYRRMEGEMDYYMSKLIQQDGKWDTYDLFEIMKNNIDIWKLAEATHNPVID
tara:strand:+ start:1534 stop:1827 length:294 start_codon:yes stop_codon:yes gene_type:complete